MKSHIEDKIKNIEDLAIATRNFEFSNINDVLKFKRLITVLKEEVDSLDHYINGKVGL